MNGILALAVAFGGIIYGNHASHETDPRFAPTQSV